MKTKVLLAALSLPLVFAACTQDEFVNNGQALESIPGNAITGLTLNIEKSVEGAETRGLWTSGTNYNKVTFEENDKISLYWLGADEKFGQANQNSVEGQFNSIFRTETGDSFTSESLVFEGGNVAVYPGDVTFTNKGQVYLTVDALNQTAETANEVPYISNQLYLASKAEGSDQTEQLPGYYGNQELFCPVKLAANVADLELHLSNIPTELDFEILSVELISDTQGTTKSFTAKSKLATVNAVPTNLGMVKKFNPKEDEEPAAKDSISTIVSQVWSSAVTDNQTNKISTKNFETSQDGKIVTARFVVLPTKLATKAAAAADGSDTDGKENEEAEPVLATSQIVIKTNCGTITLDCGAKVGGNGEDKDDVKYQLFDSKENASTIGEYIDYIATAGYATKGNFKGEPIGKRILRTLAVDVTEANLSGSDVETVADIERYIELYKALDKDEPVTLNMVAAEEEQTVFTGFTKTLAEAIAALKTEVGGITLVAENPIAAVELVNGGDVFEVTALSSALPHILSDAVWAMDDTFASAEDDKVAKIVNNGTLTINGTVEEDAQNSVAVAIDNNKIIEIGGNGKLNVASTLTTVKNSVINIGANEELQFVVGSSSSSLAGIINVSETTSMLTATGVSITIAKDGVINNYGIVAGDAGNGWNIAAEGTVNIKDNTAVTYLSDNSGTINLLKRDNEVKVEKTGAIGKIVYNWAAADGATFKQVTADKFNYVVFDGVGNLAIDITSSGAVKPVNTSMEFKGACNLTAVNVTIDDMLVAENASLRFVIGNSLTVSTLENKGTITIGGTIEVTTPNGFDTTEGRVLTTGAGAIKVAAAPEPPVQEPGEGTEDGEGTENGGNTEDGENTENGGNTEDGEGTENGGNTEDGEDTVA